ncbi:MAG: SDR family NAD(P)-dependent oxidoreductase [Gammaproteobacteria bacterium]|nr:SDR family NAD(P)-dependent oxidoreductase [Gammaproteobacteria bacterium]
MKEFAGKTAVVTGAASGIGRALADRFVAARMNVVLADIEEEALAKAVAELEAHQARVIGIVSNTMLKDSVDELARQAIDTFGNVHILCNNAGVANAASAGKSVWELPDADWQWVMGVNFWGVLYGLQAFIPHMLEHGEECHILNTASLAGVLPGGGPYGVSKHGVLSLTEGLQTDLQAREANINASVLCPGFVDTQIFDAERNRPDDLHPLDTESNEEAQALMAGVAKTMLAAGKAPAEIADIVFDAISENVFYILPHPAWDDAVRSRVEQILARGPQATTDMAELMQRREAGDQL